MPSQANIKTYENGSEVGTGDVMGVFKDGKLIDFSTYGGDYSYGKQLWQKSSLFGEYTQISSGNVAQNVSVKGTLSITGDGRVVLGGQFRTEKKSSLTGDISPVADEYTGIIAETIVVDGDNSKTNLETTNMEVGTLRVVDGIVKVHTSSSYGSGNKAIRVEGNLKDSKQVRILNKLIVENGTVTLGNARSSDADDTHALVGFGSGTIDYTDYAASTISQAFIEQSDGTLEVKGKSISVGGLNIDQSGGKMSISAGDYHIINDNGVTYDSKVTQSGDANTVLNIGKVLAYNSYKENEFIAGLNIGDAEFHVSQTGAGTINMEGVTFNYNQDASEHSSIEQSGGGTINLSGSYGKTDADSTDVFFDITQKENGGTINLNGSMTAGTVSQTAGTLAVGSSATMTAESLSAAGTLTNDGTLEVSGAMVASGKVESNNDLSAQTLEISGGTTTNAAGATLVAGSITVNGGTFINYGTITSADSMMLMTAEAEAIEEANTVNLITIASGEMEQYGTTTSNILVKDGGTLTLGVVKGQQVTTSVGAVTLQDGASMIVDGTAKTGALTLEGGTITFEVGSTLTASEVSGLENVKITLNLDAETFAGIVAGNEYTQTVFTVAGSDALDDTTIYIASEDGEQTQEVYVKQDASGNVTVGQLVVPEPTTATLSLLALAALAARRRRK